MTVTVSDHALLRYIERVAGVDLDALRAVIAGEIERAAEAGAAIGGEHRYVIRTARARIVMQGMAVVTVLPPRRDGRGAAR